MNQSELFLQEIDKVYNAELPAEVLARAKQSLVSPPASPPAALLPSVRPSPFLPSIRPHPSVQRYNGTK